MYVACLRMQAHAQTGQSAGTSAQIQRGRAVSSSGMAAVTKATETTLRTKRRARPPARESDQVCRNFEIVFIFWVFNFLVVLFRLFC